MHFRVATLFLALFLIPSLTLAQSEPVDEPPAEEATPIEVVVDVPTETLATVVPLTATLVSVGNGVNLFPGPQESPSSPVGAPIFEAMLGRPPASYELRLARPNIASYAFPCATGMCTGSASDVWVAMPTAQRQDYLTAMVSSVQQKFPRGRYADVQIRISTGEMVQCATTLSGVLTFNDGACPRT